jgi:hypothetical protein
MSVGITAGSTFSGAARNFFSDSSRKVLVVLIFSSAVATSVSLTMRTKVMLSKLFSANTSDSRHWTTNDKKFSLPIFSVQKTLVKLPGKSLNSLMRRSKGLHNSFNLEDAKERKKEKKKKLRQTFLQT